MFGGLSFLIAGHMACGVVGNDLVLRLGKNDSAAALDQPHTRQMDFTGRPIRSMIYVAPDGTASDHALNQWIKRSIKYVSTLSPKDLTADSTPSLERPTASARQIAPSTLTRPFSIPTPTSLQPFGDVVGSCGLGPPHASRSPRTQEPMLAVASMPLTLPFARI